MLTACCFQLLLGRIYTFYTPKYVFLAIIGVFEVGSIVCAAAPNSTAFIIGRAIAGLGSAGMMAGGIILLVSVVPLEKRPKVRANNGVLLGKAYHADRKQYQGLFGAVFGLASVIGPLLGESASSP